MKLALLLTIAAMITACAPKAVPVAEAPTAQACAAPGAIEKVCRRQVDRCVTPFADAGKQCTDNAQCAGDCLLVDGDPKPDGNVGACQKNDNPCGCRSPLVAGKVVNAICVD